MGLDFNSLDPAVIDSSALNRATPVGSVPASAGTALPAFDTDSISTSPLAYFGSLVQQLGQSMTAEGQSAAANGAGPAHGVGDAIDMLDSIVSMMSLYTAGDSADALPGSPKALDTTT